MRRLKQALGAAAITLAATAPAMAETATLDVTVAYLERIALPPDAEVEVELLDTSLMDVAAVRLASQRFKMTGVPFRAELAYDPALIRDGLSYTVAARIYSDRKVIFRTTTAYPVLTRGAGSEVEVILERAQAPAEEGSALEQRLDGPLWAFVSLAGTPLETDRPPTLEISATGQFGLFAGCNQFAGQADLSRSSLSFPPDFAGTLRACPQPIEELERSVLAAVGAVASFVRSGDTLSLRGDDGSEIAQLRAQPRTP